MSGLTSLVTTLLRNNFSKDPLVFTGPQFLSHTISPPPFCFESLEFV